MEAPRIIGPMTPSRPKRVAKSTSPIKQQQPKRISSGDAGKACEETNTSVYVGNLHYSCSPAQLKKLCSGVGKCTVWVPKYFGSAFIRYDSPTAAKKAVSQFHESKFLGRYLRCHLAENAHHGENADFGWEEEGGTGHTKSVVGTTKVLNPEPWQEWVSPEGVNWFQHDVSEEWFTEAEPGLWKRSVLWQHSENPSRYFIVKEEKKEDKEVKRIRSI